MRLKIAMLPETIFRFPCGDSVGHGYYIARKFKYESSSLGLHLGMDISGIGDSDSDLGDTIYSIGYGLITDADEIGYISILHRYNNLLIKSIYYHCDTVFGKEGHFVKKGQAIATIGKVFTRAAHLHLEIVKDTSIVLGGYCDPKKIRPGFLDPEPLLPFYKKQ